MSQFYTRTGDDGYAGLLGEGRIAKNHPRLETIGAIDEAMAALGMARSISQDPKTGAVLITVQRDLYHLMAEVSATPENAQKFRRIDEDRVKWLEGQIQSFGESVEIPKEFILPGDSPSSAMLALGRTIVRRAERLVVGLILDDELDNHELLRYLNRLSSLCFALEIIEINAAGKSSLTLAKED